VVPSGLTFNPDGPCIHYTMAAIFIVQATNTPLTLTGQLVVLGVDRERLAQTLDGKVDPENLHALYEGEDKPVAAHPCKVADSQPVRAASAAT
jgi:hypothetical protein